MTEGGRAGRREGGGRREGVKKLIDPVEDSRAKGRREGGREGERKGVRATYLGSSLDMHARQKLIDKFGGRTSTWIEGVG